MLESIELEKISYALFEELATHLMLQSTVFIVISNNTKFSISEGALMILHLYFQPFKTLSYEIALYTSRV